MDTIEFNNLKELKDRIKPALSSKVSELRRKNINYINEDEIFEYLSIKKWSKAKNLDLANIVDDILNTPNEEIDKYYLNKKLKEKN